MPGTYTTSKTRRPKTKPYEAASKDKNLRTEIQAKIDLKPASRPGTRNYEKSQLRRSAITRTLRLEVTKS
jgi:hypothetical protein